jgi:hypothetical protein
VYGTGAVHRHIPTLSDCEQAYDYVTDWLELEYEFEGERQDLTELNRMFAFEGPRASTPFDLRAEVQRLICWPEAQPRRTVKRCSEDEGEVPPTDHCHMEERKEARLIQFGEDISARAVIGSRTPAISLLS